VELTADTFTCNPMQPQVIVRGPEQKIVPKIVLAKKFFFVLRAILIVAELLR